MMGVALRNSTISHEDENDTLHRQLTYFNRGRLSPGFAHPYWRAALRDELELKESEGYFIEAERQSVQPYLTAIPEEAEAFVAWFEQLKEDGPGQRDPLFPWLAQAASYEQMRWFLHQEVAGEAGFDDLVALTQIKMPVAAKLELARNYWDEMGRGDEAGMHGPMLSRLADAFSVAPTPESTVWEALALGNLMSALAASRRYAYQSIGALGAIELTAPTRAVYVAAALRRLGMDGKARVYFELHATLDIRHSAAWNREVIHSLVAAAGLSTEAKALTAMIALKPANFLTWR
jgi:hypothetical protein